MTECNHNLRKIYRRDQTKGNDQYIPIDTHRYCLSCNQIIKHQIGTLQQKFEADIQLNYPSHDTHIYTEYSNTICYTIYKDPGMLFKILELYNLYQASTGYSNNYDYTIIDWEDIINTEQETETK